MKRLFDFVFSVAALIIFSPVIVLLTLIILVSSKGPPFYKQKRVGQFNKDFDVLKFRSMFLNSDKKGLLTVGNDDKRITPVGGFIRKYKLDELPQLFNVFLGDMSFVGPRPEVRKFVDLYNSDQLKVLDFKPGITDMASIEYRNENALLEKYADPEDAYIKFLMPDKIRINLSSSKESQSVMGSIRIILSTIRVIFK